MKRSTGMIAAIIAVVLVVAAVWFVTRPDADDSSSKTTATDQPANQPSETPAPPPPPTEQTSGAVTVSYTGSGFEPASVTVKSGQTLTFVNKTSSTIQPSSNPHPQHTDNLELNVGTIAGGGSKSITPKTTGSFEMHNHLNPSNTLKITVQ